MKGHSGAGPRAAVFGGRIKPRCEAPVEKWVIESEAGTGSALRDPGFGDQIYPLFADDEDHFLMAGKRKAVGETSGEQE
jgi:hypothetical protein